MERNEKFVIEVLLAITLVVFLILLSFLMIAISKPVNAQTTSIVSNSYNTNSYNAQTIPTYTYTYDTYSYKKPYVVSDRDYRYHDIARTYYVDRDLRYAKDGDRYLRYYDWGKRKTVKGVLGNEIDRYEVFIENRDYVGGYFKVVFYFEDYYGRTSSYPLTRYIKPWEERNFLFKDISANDYKYARWWYEVIPRTKVPTRVYYNDYSPIKRIYVR